MVIPTNIIRLPVDFVVRLVRNFPLTRLLVGLSVYVALNAIWGGLFTVQYRVTALSVVVVLLVAWAATHIQQKWHWHRTALDGVVGLWLLAFVVSVLSNLELWRRISLGLWFMGLYILLWYLLHDSITNQGLKRAVLVDGLLAAGFVNLVAGYVQVYQWYDNHRAGLPRVNARLDNPNPAATVALVLIPLAIARCLSTRGVTRIVFGLYAILSIGLLIFTGSRGAWVGGGVAFVLMVFLLVRHYRIRIHRLIMAGIAVATILAGIGGILVVRGVALEGRPVMYTSAIQLFMEKPITGYGLFTFGREFIRVYGIIREETTHAQSHDIFLNIAAELGLLGLLALVATAAVLVLAMRRNWRIAGESGLPQDRLLILGATVASVGFGVHHLFDMTAMLPAIAVVGLIALVVAVAPLQPVPVRWPRVESSLIGGLAVLLIATGAWEIYTFNMYVSGINAAIAGHFSQAIQLLQTAANDDPAMPVNLANLGYIQYLDGQSDAARQTMARLCQVDPYYAAYPFDNQESILHFFRQSIRTSSTDFWDTYGCTPPGAFLR